MPEIILLGLILGAIVVVLVVVVVWDFLRQRLRLRSLESEGQLKALENRITDLELENQRLRDELRWALQGKQKDDQLPGGRR